MCPNVPIVVKKNLECSAIINEQKANVDLSFMLSVLMFLLIPIGGDFAYCLSGFCVNPFESISFSSFWYYVKNITPRPQK